MTRDDFTAALLRRGAAKSYIGKWDTYRVPRKDMLLADGADVLWDYASHDPYVEWCYDPQSFANDYITFRIPKGANANRSRICFNEKELEPASEDKIDAFLGFNNFHNDDG